MEKLQIRVSVLSQLNKIAKKVSIHDRSKQPTIIRTYYAKHLFNKITLGAQSILAIIKAGLSESEEIQLLDASSIASITRDIIEGYTVFQYLCIDNISQDELDFRLNLMTYHHGYDVIKLSKLFGFDENDELNYAMHLQNKFSAMSLEKNAIFNALDRKTQKRLLDGEKAYYWGTKGRTKVGLMSPEIESGIYRLFSTSVHTLPLGVSNSNEGILPGHTHFDQLNLIFLSIEVTSLYLALTTKSYLSLRRHLAQSITSNEKKYIKEVLDSKFIDKWAQLRKEYVEKYYTAA